MILPEASVLLLESSLTTTLGFIFTLFLRSLCPSRFPLLLTNSSSSTSSSPDAFPLPGKEPTGLLADSNDTRLVMFRSFSDGNTLNIDAGSRDGEVARLLVP